MDHPGIVYHISNVLSSMGVNIESMETKTYAAPISGTPIFQLEANLAVPTRTNVNQLRERFAEIQREENIDIDLTAAKSYAVKRAVKFSVYPRKGRRENSYSRQSLRRQPRLKSFLPFAEPQTIDQPRYRNRYSHQRDSRHRQSDRAEARV